MNDRIVNILLRIKIVQYFRNKERKRFLDKRVRKLNNPTPTIISSNCNGGVLLHDLGLQFLSPTINLWFYPEDFLKLLADPQKYFSVEPVEIQSDLDYPVGKIMDITIYFQHYNSFKEAKEKWVERCKRINYNNLFIMMTDRDGCNEKQIEIFDKLPITNKVIFTHKPYAHYKSAFYIKGFEDEGECGILTNYRNGILKRRYIDCFNVIQFLNQC